MMLAQEKHISELLVWIDKNLCNPLSLDIITERSGYSKWHLQRMFRQQTHRSIAAYIRARRLYLAALSLRYTQKSILKIALEYQFDTQQTFARCFKKHFGETPGAYRNARQYHFNHLEPLLSLVPPKDISIDYVNIAPEEYSLSGQYYSYHLPVEKLDNSHADIGDKIKERFYNQFKLRPEKTYALTRFIPAGEQVKVDYIVAIDRKYANGHILRELPEISGKFCRFRYSGKPVDLHEQIVSIYTKLFPLFNLVRREGYDLTQFHYSFDSDKILHLEYEYLIPIIHNQHISKSSLPV
ncbi:helix-turn-helix domain-containing protein [Serratia sp. JSRIV006]|uniref:helix-turn-helix domain-containing protein n=1 Tax=Serratia sp. JSRIV006 TaxID=2831896 RepID=UPI001CBC6C4C|nr:helix-turn-helix domain-containing protein [Serratia sp. JSRIV006]